jgi:LmbE family N-acetylglucosaminyl deacetylase
MLPVTLGDGARSPLRVLCIGAHSDDIEIGCGGTLLRLLSERPESTVLWVVLSATPEREREARSSAAEFLAPVKNSTVVVKSFKESYFPYVAAQVKDFFEEMKKMLVPDVVFCHRRDDMHQDHRLVAELAWNTYRNHLILEYEIAKYEGDLGTPNVFVPLTKSVGERKVELLMKHFASQAGRAWFRPETFRGLMAVRAIECNAPEGLAEAFYARKLVL